MLSFFYGKFGENMETALLIEHTTMADNEFSKTKGGEMLVYVKI